MNTENMQNTHTNTQAEIENQNENIPNDNLTETDKLLQAQNQASEFQELYIRAKADLENNKKRHNEDLDKMRKFAVERFAENLLPVMDSLKAVIADNSGNIDSMKQGVEITMKQLQNTFEKQQITEINPLNEILNPAYHQAISSIYHETAPINTIIDVMQKGYKISERLLRPALVVVSMGESETT